MMMQLMVQADTKHSALWLYGLIVIYSWSQQRESWFCWWLQNKRLVWVSWSHL